MNAEICFLDTNVLVYLFTEDLQDGHLIGQLKVTNPFRTEFADP